MPATLDIMAERIPQLLAGPRGAQCPRPLLERFPDAAGLAAARLAWILHQGFADPESGHIHAPLAALHRPEGSPEGTVMRCPPTGDEPCRGAGYVLCADHSLLVFQSLCHRSWAAGDTPRTLRVLPIVFRLTPVVDFGRAPHAPRPRPDRIDWCPAPGREDAPDPILATQLDDEVCAWAGWGPSLPDLVTPHKDSTAESCWPSFFPAPDPDPERIAAFEAFALDAAGAVLSRHSGLTRCRVTVWAARPLQGGFAPPQITAHWHGETTLAKQRLDAQLYALLFGAKSPWSIGDLIGQILIADVVDGFSAQPFLLADLDLAPPGSAHARAALLQRFPVPPHI